MVSHRVYRRNGCEGNCVLIACSAKDSGGRLERGNRYRMKIHQLSIDNTSSGTWRVLKH